MKTETETLSAISQVADKISWETGASGHTVPGQKIVPNVSGYAMLQQQGSGWHAGRANIAVVHASINVLIPVSFPSQ